MFTSPCVVNTATASRRMNELWRELIICNKSRLAALHAGIVLTPPLRSIDLSGLTPDQRDIARKMLLEESESFACGDDDIGYIPDLSLNIDLSDPCRCRRIIHRFRDHFIRR